MEQVLEKKKKSMSRGEFKCELAKIKDDLPNHYGVIMKTLYPKIDIRKVYNVVNYGIHDEDILKKLKFITPSKN